MDRISPIVLRQKGAVCRRLARLASQPEIARALVDLAEEFEQAAFECEAARPPHPHQSRPRAR